MQRKHDRERATLSQKIRTEISESIDRMKDGHEQAKIQARDRYLKECATLKASQTKAQEGMRAKWQDYRAAREKALVPSKERRQFQKATDRRKSQGRGLRLSLRRTPPKPPTFRK